VSDVEGARAEGAPAEVTPAAARPRVRLAHLALRDFRNFARTDLDIPPDGLAVVGENGHGKSNLLEAVYYLQLLRSVRGARDQELVRFGAPAFHVAATADVPAPDVPSPASERGRLVARDVAVGFERGTKRKRVRLDGVEPPRLSDALGAVPSVIFSPGDVQLVAGSPGERRRYLDVVLALTSRRYLHALQAYRAALLRRNAALRDAARSARGEERVAVWEPPLAEHGALLWTERRAWVATHAAEFARLCDAIGERQPAAIGYATALPVGEPAESDPAALVARVREALERGLADKRALDVKRGVTHVGPHRDDLHLLLGGRELRVFGSAGQQRTAAIALRMLEAATLREHAGAEPLFLLDDPFAELDTRRSHRILELLGDAGGSGGSGLGQTILVVPRASDIPEELTRLERRTIRDGTIGG
jgi:DNA replication and repair protein RecF